MERNECHVFSAERSDLPRHPTVLSVPRILDHLAFSRPLPILEENRNDGVEGAWRADRGSHSTPGPLTRRPTTTTSDMNRPRALSNVPAEMRRKGCRGDVACVGEWVLMTPGCAPSLLSLMRTFFIGLHFSIVTPGNAFIRIHPLSVGSIGRTTPQAHAGRKWRNLPHAGSDLDGHSDWGISQEVANFT